MARFVAILTVLWVVMASGPEAQAAGEPQDGCPNCACVGGTATCGAGGCTSWSSRISMFGAGPSGENAAYGTSDPQDVFYLWLYESDADPTCGWRPSNGHRANILGDSSGIGVG